MLFWVFMMRRARAGLARLLARAVLAGVFALTGGCSGCDGGGFPVDGGPIDGPAPGTVSLAWTLSAPDGQPIRCDQVAANTTVFLQLRNRTSLSGAVVSFSCGNNPSTSQPLEPGTYDVTFELHGRDLASIPAPGQSGVVILPGQDTRLAPIAFEVDVRGGLALSFLAPPFTSNCKPPAMMGAEITGMTITLVHAGGGCAPVTFTRTRGTTTLGTYTVNCSSPQVASCIETDETLTATGLPSGPFTIHVRGKLGAVDCWINNDMLRVPAQGRMLIETLNLAFQSGTLGC